MLTRFGTEGALNWIRKKKKRKQGSGFVAVSPEPDRPLSDEESSPPGLSASEEATQMAQRELSGSHRLEPTELRQVWCALERMRGREEEDYEPIQSRWLQEEVPELLEQEESSLLIRFLRSNKVFRSFPAISLQWLAQRLRPEELRPKVVKTRTLELSPRSAGSFLKMLGSL